MINLYNNLLFTAVTEEVEYNHSVVDINGTDYFEFGVETSNCEIVGEPTVSLKVNIEDDDDKGKSNF